MSKNPFEVLGIDPCFDLALDVLDQRMRELSRVLHPDRHTTASSGERRQALGRSIDVNEAGRELRDPLRRARALRRLLAERQGVPFDDEQGGPAPQAFLMEMMALREQLAEARRNRDMRQARALVEPASRRQTELYATLGRLFEAALSGESTDTGSLDERLGELRYLRRVLDEVDLMEDEA